MRLATRKRLTIISMQYVVVVVVVHWMPEMQYVCSVCRCHCCCLFVACRVCQTNYFELHPISYQCNCISCLLMHCTPSILVHYRRLCVCVCVCEMLLPLAVSSHCRFQSRLIVACLCLISAHSVQHFNASIPLSCGLFQCEFYYGNRICNKLTHFLHHMEIYINFGNVYFVQQTSFSL